MFFNQVEGDNAAGENQEDVNTQAPMTDAGAPEETHEAGEGEVAAE